MLLWLIAWKVRSGPIVVLALALCVRSSHTPTNTNHQNAPIVTMNLVEALQGLKNREKTHQMQWLFQKVYSLCTPVTRAINALCAKMVNCGCVFMKSANKAGHLQDFSCPHIQRALNPVSPQKLLNLNMDKYPFSQQVKGEIMAVLDMAKNSHPIVAKVSDNMYCVCGPPTASNTVGYCHIKHLEKGNAYVCSGKDCRGISSKGKQARTKAFCIHQHTVFSHRCIWASSKGACSWARTWIRRFRRWTT